jgi:hypothetical protein
LEVYYDAKNYTSGVVQDETTNNRDAEMNATFDNGTIKAFNFTGAYTSNVTTSDHGLGTGDVTYTVSYWFKRIQQRNNYDYVYMMGNGGSTGQASLMWILNDQLHLDHWGTATKYNEPIQNNRWYHVTVGHKGGQAVTNDFLYIDGQNVGVGVSTPATFNLQGAKLTLGTSHNTTNEFLEGSIANFRVFNRALTTDEIYQLYAYQKEYFGHGDLSMTLKAGRLGIGTSEPRAALDVRGDIIGGCPAYFSGHLTSNYSGIGIVDWDTIHIIKGCIFDTSTGRLTIQVKGIYRVYYTARQLGTDATAIYLRTRVNGVELGVGYGAIYLSSTRDQAGTTVILDLNVNDIVDIYSAGASGAIASNYNAFTCEYLSST